MLAMVGAYDKTGFFDVACEFGILGQETIS